MVPPPRAPSWSGALVLAVATLIVLAVGNATTPGYDRFAFPKELLALGFAGCAVLWTLLSSSQANSDRVDHVAILILLSATISATQATNPWYAQRSLCILAAGIGLLFAARAARVSHRTVFNAIAIAGLMLSIGVLLEAWGFLPGLSLAGRAPGATLGNRNYAAQLFLVVAPSSAFSLIDAQTTRTRALYATGFALLITGIITCRTRGVWLASTATLTFAIAGVAWATKRWLSPTHRSLNNHIATLALVTAIGATIGITTARYVWRSESPLSETFGRLTDYQHGTGLSRFTQYRNTFQMVADHPLLGVGPGNWSVAYPRYAQPDDPDYKPEAAQPLNRLPNSDWAGLVSERGLVGAFLVAWFLWLTGRRIWRDGQVDSHAAANSLVLATTGIAVMSVGVFDAVLLRPEMLCLASLVFGTIPRPSAPPRAPRDPAVRMLMSFALLVVWIPNLVIAVRRIESGELRSSTELDDWRTAARLDPGDYIVRGMLATRLAAMSACTEAAEHARSTLALFPESKPARRVLDQCEPKAVSDPEASGDSQRRARVMKWLTGSPPKLVSVSPNGKLLVMKTEDNKGARLTVTELGTSTIVDEIVTPPQFLITWNPDSRSIAFVTKPVPSIYEYPLSKWKIGTGKSESVTAPVSENAMHLMRFTPDGKQLAYYRHESPNPDNGNNVEVYDFATGRSRNLIKVHEPSDFVWDPRSQTVAITAPRWPGYISLLNVRTGKETRLRLPTEAHEVRHFCFSTDSLTLMAALRGPADDFFGLARIAIATGKIEMLAQPKAEVLHPFCLDDGRVVVQLDEDASLRLAVYTPKTGLVNLGPIHGNTSLQTITPTDAIALHDTVDGDQTVLRIKWAESATATPSNAAVSFHRVTTDGGHETPVFIRSPANKNTANCAIVQAAGAGYTLRPWELAHLAQSIAAENCYAVAVNVRGIPGFGRKNEQITDTELPARDLAAVGRFMQKKYGLPRQAVIAHGLSDGASAALRAIAIDPQSFGGAMLVALLQSLPAPLDARAANVGILLLHPALDNKVTEAQSKMLLSRSFVGGIDSDWIRWDTLSGEGHIPTKPESFARIVSESIALSQPRKLRAETFQVSQ
jgi:O-antigen ligase